MTNATIAIVLVIAIGIAFAFGYGRSQRTTSLNEIEALVSQWKGWVEVSNTAFKPMFQGMIIGKAKGWEGILFAGVLVEENIPAPLAEAIKKDNPTYVSEGRILVRCLSVHDQDLIMSGMHQSETVALVEPLIKQPEKIGTRIVLNSMYLDHMDNPEGIAQFDAIWKNSTKDKTERKGC
jgi:hypothetical protein